MADRIIEIARREHVPIYENAAVVDVLARLDIEGDIPPELYRAVAEIVAFLFRAQAAASRFAAAAPSQS